MTIQCGECSTKVAGLGCCTGKKLRPCKNSPAKHEVWRHFQGYPRAIELGRAGPTGGVVGKPAA